MKALKNNLDINPGQLTKYYKNNRLSAIKGWVARYIGEILLNVDDRRISISEDWIKKAIEFDNRNGIRWLLAGDYALYAKFFERKGDLAKAKETLNKAIEIFEECGADGWVKKYGSSPN